MNEKKYNSAGRPFKMQSWVRALTRLLEQQDITFLSDSDLVFLVNRTLSEDERINKSTFEKWKAGKFHENEELGKEFIGCIELALIRQKQMLGERLMNDTSGQWTRYAWILERKFSDWNLKHISEATNKNEQTNIIQISAGSEQQKSLIDNLINPEFIEIKPSKLPEPLHNPEVEKTDNIEADDMPF